MDILLIQPRMKRRPMDTGLKAKMSPSLALLTIRSLTPPCHTVRIVNENIEPVDYDCTPDLVAITVTVDALHRAGEIARRFRTRGIPVVAGGIHITGAPDTAEGLFDAILLGRAEATWLPMLGDLANGNLQSRYQDRYQDQHIASPDYRIESAEKYIYTNVVSTSRGCPHRCDFCYNSSAGSVPYINRPIGDVLGDIDRIGKRYILFIDDNFCGNPKWSAKFLDALIPRNIKWSAAVCADIVKHPTLLDKMKESGCQSLFIGFESINPRSLQKVHKTQNNVELYENLVQALHSRGIMINASLVFGLPDDDIDTFSRTLAWLVRHKIETATAHIMTPYPGTRLYEQMLAQGDIIDNDLSHYDTAHVVFRHRQMSGEQLYEGYVGFYKHFYSFANIFRRLPADRRQRIPYLCFNLFYRKFGRFTEGLSGLVPLNALGKLAAWLSYHPGTIHPAKRRRCHAAGSAAAIERKISSHTQGVRAETE